MTHEFEITLSCRAIKQIEIFAKTYKEANKIYNDNYENYWNSFMTNATKTLDEDSTLNISGGNKYTITLECEAYKNFTIKASNLQEVKNNLFETEWNEFTKDATKTLDEDINIFQLK